MVLTVFIVHIDFDSGT